MKKVFTRTGIVFLVIFISFEIAIPKSQASYFSSMTSSFGGKVLKDKITNVTCTGSGYGPIVVSSNLSGFTGAITSQFSNSTGQKVTGGVSGFEKMIPFYATNVNKKPEVGKWILGRADIVPNTTLCKIKMGEYEIPFPVRKTSNYAVPGSNSKNSSLYTDTSIPASPLPSYYDEGDLPIT